VKTTLDYVLCLQDKSRDPANLHATLVLSKDDCQNERVGWLDDPEYMNQTQAWIEELLDEGFKPIGFEVIKKDPEVFEKLSSDWLDPDAKELLNGYLSARGTKECQTSDPTDKPA